MSPPIMYCAGWTLPDALSAVDAFPVSCFFTVHKALFHAAVTAGAFIFGNAYTHKGNRGKERIQSPQRAYKPAESPEAPHTDKKYH